MLLEAHVEAVPRFLQPLLLLVSFVSVEDSIPGAEPGLLDLLPRRHSSLALIGSEFIKPQRECRVDFFQLRRFHIQSKDKLYNRINSL